ncbi:MAG: hypothetical protein AAFN70_05200 [Planctomycetota bacterium]
MLVLAIAFIYEGVRLMGDRSLTTSAALQHVADSRLEENVHHPEHDPA